MQINVSAHFEFIIFMPLFFKWTLLSLFAVFTASNIHGELVCGKMHAYLQRFNK